MKIDFIKADKKGGENMYKATAILGMLFAIAPFVLGYSSNSAAFWTSVIVGMGVTLASLVEWASEGKDRREYWIIAVAGVLAVASPFLFNFAGSMNALVLSVTFGFVFVVTAGYKLFYKKQAYG